METEHSPLLSPETPDSTGLPVLDGTWEKKKRNPTSAAVFGLLGVGAIYFQAQTILTIIIMLIYGAFNFARLKSGGLFNLKNGLEEIKIPLLLCISILQFILFLWGSTWLVKRWHSSEVKEYVRFAYTGARSIVLAVVTMVLFLPACYAISSLLQGIYKTPDLLKNTEEGLFTAKSGGDFWLLVFVVCVTPAICEEVFFRGFFQRTLERKLGSKSVVIGGVLFGLFHMQPLGLLTLAILGILFSFYFYRSRSLFPSMAAHFTNNLIAIWLLNNAWAMSVAEKIPAYVIVLSTIAAFASLGLFIAATKENASVTAQPAIDELPNGE